MATKKKPVASVEAKVQAARDEATVKTVATLTTESVTAGLSKAAVDIQKKLAEVGGVVTSKLTELADINRTIELKSSELRELYGVEAAVVQLDQLKAEAEAVREQIQQEREAWKKDEEEGDANLLKRRKRDEDEYAYQTAVKRRAEEDSHRAKLAAAEGKLAEREAAVRAAEKELADLRAQVGAIPSLLESERSKTAAAVRAELTTKYSTEAALAKATAEAAAQVALHQIASEKAANKALADQVTQLKADIDRVRSDAKEIATKALDAGSRPNIFQVPSAPSEPQSTARR